MSKPQCRSGQQWWAFSICSAVAVIIRCSLRAFRQRNGFCCQRFGNKTYWFCDQAVVSLNGAIYSIGKQWEIRTVHSTQQPPFLSGGVCCGCMSHCLVSIKVKVSSDSFVLMQWNYQISHGLPYTLACSFKLSRDLAFDDSPCSFGSVPVILLSSVFLSQKPV